MSVWQHTKPKSGDQRRTRGGADVLALKQTTRGPYVAPWLNSWRDHVVHVGESKIGREVCRCESMSTRSSGAAWVESLALRNVICIVTRLPCAVRFATQSV